MAYAFDTLSYSERLKEGGFTPDQAKAAAEAARDFIMAELVTKPDLVALRGDLELQIKNLELRLTIRMGVMALAIISALAAIIKLT